MKVGIINYGMGNLYSVKSALDYINCDSLLVNKPNELSQCSKIILPGVGSFNLAIKNLRENGWFDEILECTLIKQVPILGICLGMHLMAEMGMEDGEANGLGFVPGLIEKFKLEDPNLKIPHIGFNNVIFKQNDILFKNIKNKADFYFVHSYRLQKTDNSVITSECLYGEKFISSFNINNIFGTQFHPEKSQGNGIKVLTNFLNFK